MLESIGKRSDLKVVRESPHGVYLQLGEEEVLLPNKYVPADTKPDDIINVFIYKDSEDRPVATTLTPIGEVGDYVALEVVATAAFGAFLEWGLEKQLLVPNSEMAQKMEVGKKYVVRIMLDYRTSRLIGVSKIEDFLKEIDLFEEGQKVSGLVYKKTDIGYKVVIDQKGIGLLYHNQVFKPFEIGQTVICYIDKVRDDNKIDLKLKPGGVDSIDEDAQRVLDYLQQNNGVIQLTDKSSPEDIKSELGMSKKAFKKAVGTLYKNRQVKLLPNEIKLVV
ncbi:MAG: S1-like domain-containing RNA-binding protein [Bacteroidota bacterium]